TRSGELAKLALRHSILNAAGPRVRRDTGCARPIGRIQRVLCCRILGLRRHFPSRVFRHIDLLSKMRRAHGMDVIAARAWQSLTRPTHPLPSHRRTADLAEPPKPPRRAV